MNSYIITLQLVLLIKNITNLEKNLFGSLDEYMEDFLMKMFQDFTKSSVINTI